MFFRKEFVLLVFMLFVSMFATAHPDIESSDTLNNKSVSFGKRFSFHTSVVDWALTIPNLGVEFDFSGKRTGHYSLGLYVKYRPKIWSGIKPLEVNSSINPRIVFNVLQVRGEIRKYWRTFVYDDYDQLTRDTTVNFFTSTISHLRYKRFSGARPNRARDWRAYYIGLFGSVDKFTYNFDVNGRTGSGVTAGICAGYTFPMYPMKSGASIDLDLGLSVGVRVQRYTKFYYEEETHCYVDDGFQDWELVKYPALADAHVSVVYRFNSIDNKVRGYDERFPELVKRWKDKQLAREDSANAKKYRRMARVEAQKEKKEALAKEKEQKKAEMEKAKADKEKAKADKDKAKADKESDKNKTKADKEAEREKAKAEKEKAKADKAAEKEKAKAEKKKNKDEKKDKKEGGDK